MDLQELLGVLIEIFLADLLFVLGMAGQKLASMRYSVSHDLKEASIFDLLKSPLWIASLITFIVGNVLETVALGFASQGSIVAAGNLKIFWNAVFAILFFGESFTIYPQNRELSLRLFQRWDLFSYVILIIGSVITVLSSPIAPDDSDLTSEELIHKWIEAPYCYFALALIILMASSSVFLWLNWNNMKVGNWNAALNGCLCASLGSFTLTMSKVTTTLLKNSFGKVNQYSHFDSWAMTLIYLLLLVIQLYLLNLALSSYEQALFVPIFTAIGTIFTIVTGLLYWNTYNQFRHDQLGWFLVGMALMCWGIIMVAHREPHAPKEIAQHFRASRGASIFEEDSFVNLPFLLGRTAHSSEPDLPAALARETRNNHSLPNLLDSLVEREDERAPNGSNQD